MEKNYRKRLIEVFSSGAFLKVHKDTARVLGPNKTMFISNLFDKLLYFENNNLTQDGWFFQTHKYQMRETGMNKYQIRKAKEFFKSKGILQTKMGGQPAKEWYYIDLENFVKFLDEEEERIKKLWAEEDKKDIPEVPKCAPLEVSFEHSIKENKYKEKENLDYIFTNVNINPEAVPSSSSESSNSGEIILEYWNKSVTSGRHKDLKSKAVKGSHRWFTVSEIITYALESHSPEQIISAIDNYAKAKSKIKMNLGQFLYDNIYQKYLSDNLFRPRTVFYDENNVFANNKYYGFELETIKNWKSRGSDLECQIKLIEKGVATLNGKVIKEYKWEFSDVWTLEGVIMGMLYHKKQLTPEEDKKLKDYLSLWHRLEKDGLLPRERTEDD